MTSQLYRKSKLSKAASWNVVVAELTRSQFSPFVSAFHKIILVYPKILKTFPSFVLPQLHLLHKVPSRPNELSRHTDPYMASRGADQIITRRYGWH